MVFLQCIWLIYVDTKHQVQNFDDKKAIHHYILLFKFIRSILLRFDFSRLNWYLLCFANQTFWKTSKYILVFIWVIFVVKRRMTVRCACGERKRSTASCCTRIDKCFGYQQWNQAHSRTIRHSSFVYSHSWQFTFVCSLIREPTFAATLVLTR